jgi:hypothetical protein
VVAAALRRWLAQDVLEWLGSTLLAGASVLSLPAIQAGVAGGQHHAPPHAGPHRLAVPPADSARGRTRMVDADQVAAVVSSTRAGGQRGEGARRPSALGLLRFRKEDADACRACAQPNLICLSFLF